MAFKFVDVPFTTDLPEMLDLAKELIRGEKTESYCSWLDGDVEVINVRQTLTQGYSPDNGKAVDGVVSEADFNKFADKHFVDTTNKLIKDVGIKLANDGWLCISLHECPDGHVKMEWLANKQMLLTFNIAK